MHYLLQCLKSDARFVIPNKKFRSFLQELTNNYNQCDRDRTPLEFSNNPNDWLLFQLECPFGMSEYQYLELNRIQNNKTNSISRQYSILIRLGDIENEVEFSSDDSKNYIYDQYNTAT